MNLTDHPEDLRNLISLITKKVLGQTTPEDDAALDAWLREDLRNETLLRELLDKQALGRAFRRRDAVDISRPLSDMEARIRRLRPIPVYRRTWFRTGVAALVTGLVCGLALWFRPGTESPLVAGLTETPTDSLIRHGDTRALLTLPSGEQVALGADEEENRAAIRAHKPKAAPAVLAMNVLTIPRGGEFKI